MTRRMRGGVGLVDVVVALVLVALLSALALGMADRAREVDNRVQCGRHLRVIGQALLLYANENKGSYPRTRFKVDAERPTAYTGWQAADPFDAEKGKPPEVNDVTAALFLLLRTQDMIYQEFVCPSSTARAWDYAPKLDNLKAPTALSRSNFPSPAFLSYSYVNPYPNKAAIALGYKANQTVGRDFAIAADMNPGGKALGALLPTSPAEKMKDGNSLNHAREGQNVLYGDGHVDFVNNPFAGTLRDNIYTVSGSDDGKIQSSATITGSPRWPGDSVLLPTAEDKGDEKAEKLSPPPAPRAPADPRAIDAKINVAKTHMGLLENALDRFEIDTGRYPTTEEGLAALTVRPALANWRGPYIRGAVPMDPWGKPYGYRSPGRHNKNGVDLWSHGPDGKEGNDDVTNWRDQ